MHLKELEKLGRSCQANFYLCAWCPQTWVIEPLTEELKTRRSAMSEPE